MLLNRIARLAPVAAIALALAAPAGSAQADQGLPPPEFPFENPLLPNQDVLGKFLFWEEQLSSDNTMSCGTCHIHEAGGSDPRVMFNPGPDGVFNTADDINGSAGVPRMDANHNFIDDAAFGFAPRVTGRKSPSAINAAYNLLNFWDGRALDEFTDPETGLVSIGAGGSLESQAAGPPLSDVEMAREGRTWFDVSAKLPNVKPGALMTDLPQEMIDFRAQYPTYPQMFNAVYGSTLINSERIIFAIANYERTLISDETLINEFASGDLGPWAPDLQPGFDLFQGKANCAACHTLPFTHDADFHNIGVRPDAEDIGREAITGDPADKGKFKTPMIFNAKLRGNLFHNGGKANLAEVVSFYNLGGDFPGPNTDDLLVPLGLTAQEEADLVHFLEVAFTDARVENGEFPFTRPTLASELPSKNSAFGVASLSGAGVAPGLLTHVPANQGHPNWLLGVTDAKANASALAAMSFLPGNGAPFFDPRFPIPMNIDLGSMFLIAPLTTDGFGTGTLKMSLPINGALAGMKFYVQFFITDAAATATGGVYGSQGAEIEII